MGSTNSMSRENKKKQLKRQIVPSNNQYHEEEDSRDIVHKAHKRVVRKRLTIFLVLVILAAVVALVLLRYDRYHQFTDYQVIWEKNLISEAQEAAVQGEGSFCGYMDFGDGVLKYTKDGASYLDAQGKVVWVQSYEMKTPMVSINGEYAAIGDQQGNSIYIFDKSGPTGTATTLLPIIKATISAHGVVAAVLEDSTSNYIYFYKNDGNVLDVKIKALLNGETGYPVDISLSPDGTQLIGAYAYLKNGALNGRVAFHNFAEIGKSVPDRVVGGFDEPYESSLVARVHFLDDTYSCAFADNSVSFYSTKNALSPELLKQVVVEEEIRSVFYSDKYVGIIVNNTDGENPDRMNVYNPDGTLVFSEAFHYQYTQADIDGEHVILYNEDSCRVYNMSGRLKFEVTFDFPVSRIRNGRFPNTLLVTGPQNMKEIRLQ